MVAGLSSVVGWRKQACCGLLLLLACGCDGDRTPFIEITELSPSNLVVGVDGSDDVRMRLHYIDPDGDIGGGTLTSYDCRKDGDGITQEFPAVASDDVVAREIEVDGELLLYFVDIAAVPAVTSSSCDQFGMAPLADDELAYCVRVSDDAGNISNPACSGVVTITQP